MNDQNRETDQSWRRTDSKSRPWRAFMGGVDSGAMSASARSSLAVFLKPRLWQ